MDLLLFESTDFADYTDFPNHLIDFAKPVGFNSLLRLGGTTVKKTKHSF